MAALKDALSELREVSEQLNEESDSVNDLISSVEDSINKASPGVEVWFNAGYSSNWIASSPCSFQNDRTGAWEDYWRFWVLGYGRFRDEWRILAKEGVSKQKQKVDEYQERETQPLDESRPLLDCQRDVRVAAAPKLEQLVKLISKDAAQKLEALREAKLKAK